MKERFRNGHALDFQDLISRFTLDSATEFLFGHCVHSLRHDLPYAHNDRPSLEVAAPSKGASALFSEAFADVPGDVAVLFGDGSAWFHDILNGMFNQLTINQAPGLLEENAIANHPLAGKVAVSLRTGFSQFKLAVDSS